MDEIPEDVKLTAMAFTAGWEHNAHHMEAIRVTIARAIMAERERCARAAEALDRRGREWVPDSLWDNIKRDTAAAIREGQP